MSMLRQDPLTGRWVILAADRGARPNEFQVRGRAASPLATCPFCPGHEDQTTPEILTLGRPTDRPANSPGWRLRVFANLYPALVPTGAAVPFGVTPDLPDVLFEHAVGVGRHEVVVYTPDHEAGPASLPSDRLAELLGVLRERSRVFAQHPDVRYVSPFCNHGPDAGATLRHPHMQIIGAPQVPLLAVAKAQRFAAYRAAHGRCMVCDLEQAERASGARLIAANDHWTVVMPWASRFPWEMIFMPRRHGPSWNQAPDAELTALAEVLAPALRALQTIHGDLSLNLVIHGAALDAAGNDEDPESYHWHLEVLPRLSRPAGFEVGTGYTINSVVPEDAARRMRREWDQT